MSDDARTPHPDQPEVDRPAEPDSSEPERPQSEPLQPGRPEQAGQPERTGIIDLAATQAIPSTSQPTTGAVPEPSGPPPAEEHGGWFEVFGGEHPTEGPVVPARADSTWGSDRADALAEEAHRAAHTPPTAPVAPASEPQAVPAAGAAAIGGASAAGADDAASTSVPGAAPDPAWPAPSGVAVPLGPEGSAPAAPSAVAAPPRRHRGRLAAGVVALCLLSGVAGGVAGQVLEDRVRLGGSTLPEPGPGSTARPAGSVANIAARALPSVVTIKVMGDGGEDATGSGFVVDARGHVLTNNHVVALAANGGDLEVVLSNGDTEKATIVGRDVSYDLAVLKIDRTDLTPLQLGPSDKVVVGDQVIAVGAPLGLDQTVTTGIVSALNRPVTPGAGDEASYINAIQTDAAINPGNSGGPLLDMNGRVIGVNSAIARVPGTSGSTGGNIGLGFAIPSDQARRTADQLIATGKATHPVIGVLLDRTFSGDGAHVTDGPNAVTAGGPAAKAGVKPGDVIIAFEGKRVRTPDQLIVSVRSRAVGDTVSLRVLRDGKELELRMTLEADPTG